MSPALARLIAASPPNELGDRFGAVAGTISDAGLMAPDELAVVVGRDAAELRAIGARPEGARVVTALDGTGRVPMPSDPIAQAPRGDRGDRRAGARRGVRVRRHPTVCGASGAAARGDAARGRDALAGDSPGGRRGSDRRDPGCARRCRAVRGPASAGRAHAAPGGHLVPGVDHAAGLVGGSGRARSPRDRSRVRGRRPARPHRVAARRAAPRAPGSAAPAPTAAAPRLPCGVRRRRRALRAGGARGDRPRHGRGPVPRDRRRHRLRRAVADGGGGPRAGADGQGTVGAAGRPAPPRRPEGGLRGRRRRGAGGLRRQRLLRDRLVRAVRRARVQSVGVPGRRPRRPVRGRRPRREHGGEAAVDPRGLGRGRPARGPRRHPANGGGEPAGLRRGRRLPRAAGQPRCDGPVLRARPRAPWPGRQAYPRRQRANVRLPLRARRPAHRVHRPGATLDPGRPRRPLCARRARGAAGAVCPPS